MSAARPGQISGVQRRSILAPTRVSDQIPALPRSHPHKKSSNPTRTGFRQAGITLYAWTVALATHALADLTNMLPSTFRRAHPRTLRRWFLHTPAALFLGQGTLIVALQPRVMLQTWHVLIDRINRSRFHIPWLDNRRLVLSIERNAVPDVRKLDLIRSRCP